MRLKSPNGWFAAGREMEQALWLLSDSAFRLFVWICLRADRSSGSLRSDPTRLARALRRTREQVVRDLDELARYSVCRREGDRVLIQDRFWPYERHCADSNAARSSYIAAIQNAFLRPACVASTFTAADEKVAQHWQQRGIALETVERTILLGTARKYATWLNHGVGSPITSLEYFASILSEVEQASASSDYWEYLAQKVQKFEAEFRRRMEAVTVPITETK
jgi:hypothetical protein